MTDTPRRVIKITVSARNAADSPALLKNVEAAFQHDDLDIDIRETPEATPEPVEVDISTEALEATGDALDLNDQLINQGIETVPESAEAEDRVRKWLKIIRKNSIRVLARAAAKAVFSKILDML